MINKEQVQGKAKQLSGSIKKAWGNLTDDEVTMYEGQQEKFFGVLQEKYGLTKEAAQKKLKEIEDSCGCDSTNKAA